MAQSHSNFNQGFGRVLKAENQNVAVPQAGDTVLLTDIPVIGIGRVFCQFQVVGQALDNFIISGKAIGASVYQSLYTAGFVTPTGILIGTSDDLDVATVGHHWFLLDVRGLEMLKLEASSGNVAGSTVHIFLGGY